MPEQQHLPLSLVGELLVKPALRSLGIEVKTERVDGTPPAGRLPSREGTHYSVQLIPIMADPEILERVLKALRKL